MELGAQDFKYYEESGKKAAAAGAAVGGTAGALYGVNKAINNSNTYKQGMNLINALKTQKKGIKKNIADSKTLFDNLKNTKAKKSVLDDINNLKKQKKNLKRAINKTHYGLISRSFKDLGKKGTLKAAAKYGVPAAVATGLAAYGVHKYKHKNESVEVENNMSAINLYETEYDGVYATEDGYLVDEDGNLYDGDGDLIEENAIILEGEKMNKAKAYGKEAAKAASVGIAAGNLASGAHLIKHRKFLSKMVNRSIAGNTKALSTFNKANMKAGVKGAAAGLATYGAYKAYKHLKNKKAAKNESVVTDYDGLA